MQIGLFPDEESDRGVSPVIGVILMVAITVILAAVIGTFVLNLSGSVNEQASAGVSVEADTGNPGSNIVTITSIGSKTDAVACVSSSGVGTSSSQVGATLTCPDGNSVIAIGEEGIEDKTLQSNIDADGSSSP